jgi:hypothetical protein
MEMLLEKELGTTVVRLMMGVINEVQNYKTATAV